MQTPSSTATLIATVRERLAHMPSAKQTRTEVWTACGKRIRTDAVVRRSGAEMAAEGYAICGCAEARS